MRMKFLSVLLMSIAAILLLAFTFLHGQPSAPIANVHSNWENRNWYAIGDSITYANHYQPIVKSALAMKSVTVDAVPGQSMRTMTRHLSRKKLRSIDLITVFGGTNDYGKNTPLGTPKDGVEDATFYGYVKKTIEKINATKTKGAVVVFITPLKRGAFKDQPVYPNRNLVGSRLEDYVQVINDVCAAHSIPVIDLFHHSGLELGNLSKYTKDNLHPNAAGYRKLSKVVITELNRLDPHRQSPAAR